jgi:cysteine desulfurase/selenocysteine lyase
VDVKKICEAVKNDEIAVLVDGSQSAVHLPIDVKDLGCDFFAITGHKLYGPSGSGAIYIKRERLNEMQPFMGGGDMIKEVQKDFVSYNVSPHKFEAGTPNIAGGIAFGAALDYMNSIGYEAIASYEAELLDYATTVLKELPGLKIYGEAPEKTAVISFNVKGIHPYDIGSILDQMGIAVRTGHHCAQPIMDYFQIPGTIRASFSFYNTKEEVDRLIEGLRKAMAMLQ